MIRHFDILYIQQGISRLPLSDRLELLPILIQGISSDYEKSPQHASQLFHLILRLLTHFKLPLRGSKEDDELRSSLAIKDEDASFLSHWFGKLILLTITRNQDPAAPIRCAGLSFEEYKFLTLQGRPDAWDPSSDAGLNLIESKALVTRLLASGLFIEDEKFFPALFASADTNSRISEVGEDVLKRVMISKDLESAEVVKALLELYFGSSMPEGALAVKVPLRIRILGVLSKSTTCTTFPKDIARIVEEGLLSPELSATNKTTAGREASKYRSAIFALVNFVARKGATEHISTIAEGLVGNLRAFLQDQGWPVSDRDQDMELRGYGYETIGLLAKAAPKNILLEPNLDLLGWLFRSLREDASGKEVTVSIDEALSSVLGAFTTSLNDSIRPKFRQILLRYSADRNLTSESSSKILKSTRYTATRFANRCLAYNDVLARWIDILAVSGGSSERHEILEEGRKGESRLDTRSILCTHKFSGLDPYWFSMSNSMPGTEFESDDLSFPNFDELVQFIFSRQEGEDDDDMDVDYNGDVVSQARLFQHRFSDTLPTVIAFCIQVAIHTALAEKDIHEKLSEDWGRKLETLISTDLRARQAFRAFASKDAHATSLATLLRASFDRLTRDELSDVGDIGSSFVRLLSLCPEQIWKKAALLRDFRALEPSVLANNANRRLAAAHAYGLLASHNDADTEFVDAFHSHVIPKIDQWETAVGAEINQIGGASVALGYYYSRLCWRSREKASSETQEPEIFSHERFQNFLKTMFAILKGSKDATLQSAMFSCIDQLALFHVLKPSVVARYVKFQDVIQQIYDSAKKGTTSAILALGHLSMATEESNRVDDSDEKTDYEFVAEKMYELHEVRQSEVQFSVGEALSCFACGWESKALTAELDIEHPAQSHDPWDIPLTTPIGPKRENTLTAVLEKTVKGCRQTKPSLKKASVIWLLCLLQYCGHKPEMQQFLPQCQLAFKYCLSDRDEVVQEAASRGLGLVYEKGDRQLKDDLVRDLVGSFSDNKSKMSGTVSEDTQLFEPGALPTGDGSITTYKDILSLASEVGDSSLVYRFMSLASNNSIWSSRAAFGRFGLSNIFSDSSVDGYLAENPKLYPKLYRYRYVIMISRMIAANKTQV